MHEFTYPSSDGRTQIHAVRYVPEGPIRAILQISHGMVEHIGRYHDFACFLQKQGILVTGNDHLGHGQSVCTPEDYGYFGQPDGNRMVLEDLHQLTLITKEVYPGIPYFLLGHSMGSFYARQYLCEYGQELTGAIIMGTGFQPKLLLQAGILITHLRAASKGWRYRSSFVNSMAFGSYNSRFKPARTDLDWLSRDPASVDAYIADERCGFLFTLNAYCHMFRGILRLHDRGLLSSIPKNLPVFFVSGSEDPVGEFSKGVIRARDSLVSAGMERVDLKLYEKDRHEILNEVDRHQVYEDLKNWIFTHLP